MGKFLEGLAGELILHVRQLGWLSAVPRPPKSAKGEPDRRNRMKRLKDHGREPDLPEVTAAHLLGYLMEIGPAAPSAAGPIPINHTDIRSWQDNTGIELSAWEARTLRACSREYVSELSQGEDPTRPAPYMPPESAPVLVAMNMRAAVRAMAED